MKKFLAAALLILASSDVQACQRPHLFGHVIHRVEVRRHQNAHVTNTVTVKKTATSSVGPLVPVAPAPCPTGKCELPKKK